MQNGVSGMVKEDRNRVIMSVGSASGWDVATIPGLPLRPKCRRGASAHASLLSSRAAHADVRGDERAADTAEEERQDRPRLRRRARPRAHLGRERGLRGPRESCDRWNTA